MYRVLIVGFSDYAGISVRHLASGGASDVSIREVADLGQADAILGTNISYRLFIVALDSGDLQSLAALQRLRKKYHGVVMFALVDPEAHMAGAVSAMGNLLRNLIDAPAAVARPLRWGCDVANETTPYGGSFEYLTPRQWKVLGLMKKGRSNKEIGREMNISESTVKVHGMAIFRVLGVSNRTQAALAVGLLDEHWVPRSPGGADVRSQDLP